MRVCRRAWGVFMALLAIGAPSSARAGSAPPDFRTAPATIGKCLNLANTLEPPNEGDWGPPFRDEDARIIRAAGFMTVRVPVNFLGHASSSPYAVERPFITRVRHVIDTLRAAGLTVIVDQHNNDAMSAAPEANRERLAAVWRDVAASLSDEPANVWFELLNEPHDHLTNANLMATLLPSLGAIRATNPSRIVVIGGEHWSGIDSLASLPLPDDPYVVPTFHYYDPFEFTHQGATFIHPAPPFGRSFGSAADAAQLKESVAKVRRFMERTGRMPLVGEYGAIDTIPLEQRTAYYRAVSSAFASLGVASCAWGYRNAFPLWRNGDWLPGIVGAISAPR